MYNYPPFSSSGRVPLFADHAAVRTRDLVVVIVVVRGPVVVAGGPPCGGEVGRGVGLGLRLLADEVRVTAHRTHLL